MNNNELQNMVESISNRYFNEPFRHNALFNNKLRTTGGRYMLDSHNIEINLNNISIMVKCINRYN